MRDKAKEKKQKYHERLEQRAKEDPVIAEILLNKAKEKKQRYLANLKDRANTDPEAAAILAAKNQKKKAQRKLKYQDALDTASPADFAAQINRAPTPPLPSPAVDRTTPLSMDNFTPPQHEFTAEQLEAIAKYLTNLDEWATNQTSTAPVNTAVKSAAESNPAAEIPAATSSAPDTIQICGQPALSFATLAESLAARKQEQEMAIATPPDTPDMSALDPVAKILKEQGEEAAKKHIDAEITNAMAEIAARSNPSTAAATTTTPTNSPAEVASSSDDEDPLLKEFEELIQPTAATATTRPAPKPPAQQPSYFARLGAISTTVSHLLPTALWSSASATQPAAAAPSTAATSTTSSSTTPVPGATH